MLLARSPEATRLFEERLVEPAIARAKPGETPAGARARLEGRLWNRLSALL